MFYPKSQVYIINDVFFDLKKMKIFLIEPQTRKEFEILYNGGRVDIEKRSNNYEYLLKEYFTKTEEKSTSNPLPANFSCINNVQLKISNTCNMKCDYCYANKGNYGKKDSVMSLAVTNASIEFINNKITNIKKISFFGGEPFLNIQSMELFLKNIKNRNILYSTVTNGTLLNSNVINLLKTYNLKFILSLDGFKEIHDFHRKFKNGRGSFEVIKRNLTRLSSQSIYPTMIEGVYTRKSELEADKENISDWLYKNFNPKFIGLNNVVTDVEEYKPKNETLQKLEDSVNLVFDKIEQQQYFFVSYVYTIITMIMDRKKSNYFCGAGLNSIFINEKGDIYPCQLFDENKEYYMGNVFNSNLKNYENTNYKLNSINRNKLKKCEQCICSFWCTACIGNKREFKNVECQVQNGDCLKKQRITELTLNRFSLIIQEGKLEKFKTKVEKILYENKI